jgi:hypothetical protein
MSFLVEYHWNIPLVVVTIKENGCFTSLETRSKISASLGHSQEVIRAVLPLEALGENSILVSFSSGMPWLVPVSLTLTLYS